MGTISNTPRPGYVWDSTDNVWYPIGVGGHDHGEIQKVIVDAKGDLIVGTAADTVDRLAVGADGSSIVADSSTSTGLRYQANFAAGKNKVINGDFGIWQRGTSITIPNGAWTFASDRWQAYITYSAGTCTVSRQTFTPGTAPVAGYEGQYFLRATAPTTGTGSLNFRQLVENVQTFAGQTITVSFWAKASTSTSMAGTIRQNFGSGGSASVDKYWSTFTVTTDWQRFTQTFNIDSIAGKTIGTGSALEIYPYGNNNFTSGATIDFWGFQVEAGSVATAFQTATGTIQGELAACQRYYQRKNSVGNGTIFGMGQCQNTTNAYYSIPTPVVFRAAPSVATSSVVGWTASTGTAGGTIAAFNMSADAVTVGITGASGLVAGNASALSGTTSSAYIELSAEL